MLNNILSRLFIFIILCGLTSSPAYAFDHPRYSITADIDTDKKSIQASQTVTFTNNTSNPTPELYFHVYPNRKYTAEERDMLLRYAGFFKVNPYPEGFQTADFKLKSVKQGENDLSFVFEGEDKTLLKVDLAQPLAPGASIEVALDYSLTVPHAYGRFGWHKNIMALSRWYPILSVYDENGWRKYPFYPFHRPFYSEASQYSVKLTVPNSQTVIHSGDEVELKESAGGKKEMVIESQQPIREFSLSLSPDYKVVEEDWENIKIKSWYLPGHEEKARLALKDARGMMEYYARHFGAYPYATFSLAPVYLGYGGEQMSNMAFFDTRIYELPRILNRYFDFLIAHETGHQWLYNMVGMDEYKEIWLEEGVHSYFLLRYLEEKYGPDAEIAEFPAWFKHHEWFVPPLTFRSTRDVRYKVMSRVGYDSPVVRELSRFPEPGSVFSIAYGKGSRIVEMLGFKIGVDTLDRAFKKIFAAYQFQNLSIDQFKKICEEESGMDLTAFFQQWLYTKERFDVAVTGVEHNQISVKNNGGIQMPVEMKVEYTDGTSEELIWNAEKQYDTLEVKSSSKIKRVTVDPEGHYLDFDATNNSWPRKVRVKPALLYTGLYDIPGVLKDDAYNVVVGPEIHDGVGLKASFQKPYDQYFYTATDYDFAEKIHSSRVGYQLNNIFHTQTALGLELKNETDHDDGDEDLVSGKVFLRRELWPVQYGLTSMNDHATLYLLRNKSLNNTLLFAGSEDQRNVSYLKRDESIVGLNLHFERNHPYPDPNQGYKIDALVENSGHFLGATQYFSRAAIDTAYYLPATKKTTIATRLKFGGGYPDDRNLFELGGIDGLRGYDRKSLRGANILLGSLEYRFPLKEDIRLKFLDNAFAIESISGVMFFDAGHSWHSSIADAGLKKDAGVGLRMTLSIGSFLEKMVVRADVAQAIHDDGEDDPRFWFGVNQAF